MSKKSSDTTKRSSLIQRRTTPSGTSVVQRKTRCETLHSLKEKRVNAYHRPRLSKESGFVITQRIGFAFFFSLIVAVLAAMSVPDAWDTLWPMTSIIGWGIFAILFLGIVFVWPTEALMMTDNEWTAWKKKRQEKLSQVRQTQPPCSSINREKPFDFEESSYRRSLKNPLNPMSPMYDWSHDRR